MKLGDMVRVFPHGSPDMSAEGVVALLSKNRRSIAVGFDSRPPFVSGGLAIHPEFGIIMLASREAFNGVPWGPWREAFGGGHYEIEAIPA